MPVRTALGMMAITFDGVLFFAAINDWIAFFFNIPLDATTWIGRIGLLLLPPLAYYVTYRYCLSLREDDRDVLEHGIETGIVRRLPHGEFIEVHQPLGGRDDHGHPVPLQYAGTPVPKRMNELGVGGPAAGVVPHPRPARGSGGCSEGEGRSRGARSGRT